MRGRIFVFNGQEQRRHKYKGQKSDLSFRKSQCVRDARSQPQQKSVEIQRAFLTANVAFSRFSNLAFSFWASAMVTKLPTWTVCNFF